jgi:hypothetical protein
MNSPAKLGARLRIHRLFLSRSAEDAIGDWHYWVSQGCLF